MGACPGSTTASRPDPVSASGPVRYFVRSGDGRAIHGFARLEAASLAAIEHGVGAHLVDTLAQAYFPIVQEVALAASGEKELTYLPFGGWDTGRFGHDRDLIEAIKKGHVAIVHAFLAKGASANARDAKGGPALHWAAGRGVADVVRLLIRSGADVRALDAGGKSALDIARGKGRAEIADILERAGA